MSARPPADAHVLVAGVGGIGCPAAWGLAAAGVGRITLLDPDVVERSNLPRQVLFADDDLGAPKALRAAARLAPAAFAGGVHARLDDRSAATLLDGVDVVIDATDGAHAKDWINQLAVRRGVPLVHAAGLRSEARLLVVPAGGKPCLACLFGRLQEETGSCADLGVWNGVVGVVGFLAAQVALDLLAAPATAGRGYAVLDFEGGRALTLDARAAADCPVCASPAGLESYPEPFACASPHDGAPAARVGAERTLDLRAERCPLNLLRARRALADLPAGAVLAIRLGAEGAATVPDGVRALGHRVLASEPEGEGLALTVQAVATAADDPAFDGEALQRYARQIVLPEVGERGQRALLASTVRLLGAGPARECAAVYLRAAGVGVVAADAEAPDVVAWAGGAEPPADLGAGAAALVVLERHGAACRAGDDPSAARGIDGAPPAVALAWGALLADAVERQLVLGGAPATFAVGDGGRV